LGGEDPGPGCAPLPVGAGAGAPVLGVEHGLVPGRVVPVLPSDGEDDVGDMALDEDDARVGAPGAAEVDLSSAGDEALVEHEPGLGVRLPVLRRDGPAGPLGNGVQLAVLVDRLAVPDNIVDRPLNVTAPEVVPPYLVVKRVLRSVERTPVKRPQISLDPKRHCLFPHRTTRRLRRGVLQKNEKKSSEVAWESLHRDSSSGDADCDIRSNIPQRCSLRR
jgi:hypothetical protein